MDLLWITRADPPSPKSPWRGFDAGFLPSARPGLGRRQATCSAFLRGVKSRAFPLDCLRGFVYIGRQAGPIDWFTCRLGSLSVLRLATT